VLSSAPVEVPPVTVSSVDVAPVDVPSVELESGDVAPVEVPEDANSGSAAWPAVCAAA
jgi:hypothetical protein